MKLLPTSLDRISRFAAVGILGFVVDAGVLWLAMHWAGLGLYSGRIVSFALGATATWYCNRSFTYRDRETSERLHQQWLRYMAASVAGAASNYATYAGLVATCPFLVRHPTLAVAAGSGAGLLFNYSAYSRFVFRARPPVAVEAPLLTDDPQS
jgi:putative flippase GtrA